MRVRACCCASLSLCVRTERRVREHVPPRGTPAHLQAITSVLERVEYGDETDLSRSLHELSRQLVRRGLIVVLSDLLDEPEVMASDQHSSYALSSTERDLAAVISVSKLRGISDDDAFRRSLIRLTAHSFGHIFEGPSTDRPKSAVRTFGDIHCSNTCVMRHAGLVGDLLDLSLDEHEAKVLFCEECEQDILEHSIKNHFSLS